MSQFSVLLSVYYKETANNLSQCLESLAAQTVSATEIIIVKDGVLTAELEECLASWQNKLPLKIVGYEENKGLAYALNYGLQYCSYELIARMDSDDICVKDRFERQINYFQNNQEIALLSGYISEFNHLPNDIVSIRKVPIGYSNIIRYLKKRNAFNHMAVMFKKSALLTVGCYQYIDGFEDYDLWIRLVQAGYKVNNLSEILVYARIGNNMIVRRNGIGYAKQEILFFRMQKQKNFISEVDFFLLMLFRIPVRLIPSKILAYIYHYLRKS